MTFRPIFSPLNSISLKSGSGEPLFREIKPSGEKLPGDEHRDDAPLHEHAQKGGDGTFGLVFVEFVGLDKATNDAAHGVAAIAQVDDLQAKGVELELALHPVGQAQQHAVHFAGAHPEGDALASVRQGFAVGDVGDDGPRGECLIADDLEPGFFSRHDES